jgi:vacuolar-type H+-ATPase subunit E/Vma4
VKSESTETNVQRIVDRILDDAQREATALVEQAQKSAETSLANESERARQKALNEIRSGSETNDDRIRAIRETVFAEARRKANWMVLSEKELAVNGVLNEVRENLCSLAHSKKYIRTLGRLIVDGGVALGGGKLEVALNEIDSRLPLDLGSMAEVVAEKTQTESELQISREYVKTSGGAIIRKAEGRILVDNTFEAILKRSEPHVILKIAKVLFG